jgi:hypothetical protein
VQNKEIKQQSFNGLEPISTKDKLVNKFLVPPFSILDTRQGYWQDRKRMWISLGIKSELGRGENATFGQGVSAKGMHVYYELEKEKKKATTNGLTFNATGFMAEVMNDRGGGTSLFDPVLTELIYRWFAPTNGSIFDLFAGGSVRGIVAGILGYKYTGIDLSKIQIDANNEQVEIIKPTIKPEYIQGDTNKMNTLLPANYKTDIIIACPPYHDLEKYSDDMDDLSNMSWDTFRLTYTNIIKQSILHLNDNRFAVFVVSEIRNADRGGGYKGFVPLTIKAFVDNGARYYNEMILVNVAGSLPARIQHQFTTRKIGKMHQNVLVFYKGDPEKINSIFPEINFTPEVLNG